MKTLAAALFAQLATFVLLAGCPARPPSPPPRPDADAAPPPYFGDAGDPAYRLACAKLAALGCSEGSDQAACAAKLQDAEQAHLATFALLCVATAPDVPTLRACPGGAWVHACAGR